MGDVIVSEWLLAACISGVITLHGVMPSVLQVFPERHCADCNGYVAPIDCNAMGRRYGLFVNGKAYRVAVADCVTTTPPALADWPRKGGRLWLGDVDATVWVVADLPLAPFPAILCPDDIPLALPFDWRLYQ